MSKEKIDNIKNKFIKHGYKEMSLEEILILNLYYAGQKNDAIAVTKELLSKYNSFSQVLINPKEILHDISKINESSTAFFNILTKISRIYVSDRNMLHPENLNEQLAFHFVGQPTEIFAILLLDNNDKILLNSTVCKGIIRKVDVRNSKIIDMAKEYKATKVIIAHNHPYGFLRTSIDDILFTRDLLDALKLVNIVLIDHLVFRNEDYISIKNIEEGIFLIKKGSTFSGRFFRSRLKNNI